MIREEKRDVEHVALELQVLGREPHAELDAVGESGLQPLESAGALTACIVFIDLFDTGSHLDREECGDPRGIEIPSLKYRP